MKPSVHLTISVAVSLSIYAASKSVKLAAASFIGGFLLDLDHFFDYFREYGLKIKINEFFDVFYETRFKKLILPFHAWEWLPVLLVFSLFSAWNSWTMGFCIGMTHHMVLDQSGNNIRALGYFFVYRAIKGFAKNSIIR